MGRTTFVVVVLLLAATALAFLGVMQIATALVVVAVALVLWDMARRVGR
jgi:hypothetical protein